MEWAEKSARYFENKFKVVGTWETWGPGDTTSRSLTRCPQVPGPGSLKTLFFQRWCFSFQESFKSATQNENKFRVVGTWETWGPGTTATLSEHCVTATTLTTLSLPFGCPSMP